jgi:hypothetical protein
MAITNYSELQTSIGTWLNRSDLTSVIPDFITLAESKLNKDQRMRRIQTREPLSVSTEQVALPSDFRQIKSLYHDGPTYYHPIRIVGGDELAQEKRIYGADSGVPFVAAVLDDELWFAPEPNATFSLIMAYEAKISALSASSTTNWLITNHPEIYLYASLVEAEPYLKDDPRIQTWKGLLEEALELLYRDAQRHEFSGHMVSRPRMAIGDDRWRAY